MTYEPTKKKYQVYLNIQRAVDEYIDGGVCPNYANQLVTIKLATMLKNSGIMLSQRMLDISRIALGLPSVTINRPNRELSLVLTTIVSTVYEVATDSPNLMFTNIESKGINNLIIVFET